MAAPANKTIGDLNGKWVMNKSQSSNVEPGLALQGIGWVTRKAVTMTTLTLHVKQYVAPPSPPADPATSPEATHIEIEQTGTGGFKGSTERRCLDGTWREHTDWLFGHVRGRTTWLATAADAEDEFLAAGWLEGDEEKTGPAGEAHVRSYVESLDSDWTATQIWGFKLIEGVRKYCRNVVIAKGEERVELQLVYDFIE
ncbi:uncharacterized protein THITE_2047971 [Thermothielavioides terrestris NRRL 8126]|uniref:Lipocalin-like domain-containing protein n=1 Tax=Thermothielavioides terrestris (strain ATCC 38088 / NRRL 8126) TaxID=578455 RepID=G2R4S7_THETT|nr:uncharacterized protein THITE_2047971 [Thermothielavioides terrestris NRRL 8126]AEO66117.1 hypothetical protein THITE_2047971 [Thermothielavioides terrestris NRRL 8126]